MIKNRKGGVKFDKDSDNTSSMSFSKESVESLKSALKNNNVTFVNEEE